MVIRDNHQQKTLPQRREYALEGSSNAVCLREVARVVRLLVVRGTVSFVTSSFVIGGLPEGDAEVRPSLCSSPRSPFENMTEATTLSSFLI